MPARTEEEANAPQHSPSSPTVPPPVADAPGPRAQALCNAFDKALESTLRRCNYDNFAACFPTPAEHRAETLDQFWREFVGRLETFCKENFEQLLADRAVVPSLNELHRLIEDAKSRKLEAEAAAGDGGQPLDVAVAPHTLPPSALYSSNVAPFLATQQEMVSGQLSELQEENLGIMRDIESQRAEMQHLLLSLENIVDDLDKTSELMKGGNVQGLVGETRSMATELQI